MEAPSTPSTPSTPSPRTHTARPPQHPIGTPALGFRVSDPVLDAESGWTSWDVAIPGDLDGPPRVLQGGLVTGLSVELARALVPSAAPLRSATVRLEAPTPLGTTIAARARSRDDGGVVEVETSHDGRLLTRAEVVLLGHAPLDMAVDLAALALQPLPAPSDLQPHPTCFACGGSSPSPLSLRLRPGAVGPRAVVAPWVPDGRLAGPDGTLGPMPLAAALDCPPAWALLGPLHEAGYRDLLLGTMELRVAAPVEADDPLVLTAIADASEGRKLRARAALVDTDGRVLAMVSVIDIAVRALPGRG